MRWPWSREDHNPAEADEARRQAQRARQEAEAQHAYATELAQRLEAARARNHFGAAVASTMRRRATD